MLKVNIDFKNKIGRFLDSQMVNKLLIQRNDTAFFIKEDMLDLKVVEDLLISNPMIANADIFRTPQGFLNVKLEERKPIIRIIITMKNFMLMILDLKFLYQRNIQPEYQFFMVKQIIF